jgi:hypothetical protein
LGTGLQTGTVKIRIPFFERRMKFSVYIYLQIMNMNPINTEEDYKIALNRLEAIFDASIGTTESDEADELAKVIEEYENENYPI